MLDPSYLKGQRYAVEYWACPCFKCLLSWFGYDERGAYCFRQGFYDQARSDWPLDCIERVTSCSICDISGGEDREP